MDDWWAEIETTVRAALRQQDELSVDEVATALGVSRAAAASLLGVLAADGAVRIVRIAAGNPVNGNDVAGRTTTVTSTETCAICGARPDGVELVWWFVDGARRAVHTDCWIAEHEKVSAGPGRGSLNSAA